MIEDGRRKNWVLLKTPKGKEKEDLVIGKTLIKTPKKILTEHWNIEQVEGDTKQLLKKCNRCKINNKRKPESCKK